MAISPMNVRGRRERPIGSSPESSGGDVPSYRSESERLDAMRDDIRAALAEAGGRVSGAGGAAELLGIKPTTLASRMRTLGVERPG